MHPISRSIFFILITWLIMTGCQRHEPAEPAVSKTLPLATETVAAAINTSTLPDTPTPLPAPLITPIPTSLPTLEPSPTPQPPLIFAVRPDWSDIATAAVDQLNQNSNGPQWQLVFAEKPGELLAVERADAALVEGDEGTIIQQNGIALAVPFTTEWENVTETDAQAIIMEGHDLVTLMNWQEMSPTHKALRIDGRLPNEADYPFKERWSLLPAEGYEAVVAELATKLRENLPPQPLIHLAAVGDIMLDRSLGATLLQGDLAHPFAGVIEPLLAADITIGNLESALGDMGQPALKHYTFRAPPQAASALAQAGFDVLTLANNHAMDFGPEALSQGISLLHVQDIATIGAGANDAEATAAHFYEINGLTLAFLGYVNVPVEVGGFDTETWKATDATPGLAWGTPENIKADVTATLPLADIVIVLLHSGYEYVEAPSDPQIEAAQAAIDAGAKLVIGHHAHILQGIEYYKDGVIVYGLGNFAFQIEGDPQTAILNVWIDQQGVRQLEIMPAIIRFGGRPRLAEPWEASQIRQRVYHLTNLLN